jgi:hypothetical protein
MLEREREGLAFPDHAPDRPPVVEEAGEVLASYGRQLAASAGTAAVVWLGCVWLGTPVPPLALVLFLAVLILLYISPVTRQPRLAREVLRRWDEMRVQRALDRSGVSDDPRLEVAEAMAHRITRHPAVLPDVSQAAEMLANRLRLSLSDLRCIEQLGQAAFPDDSRGARSVSDVQDTLDARVAGMVAQLAELHRAVVLRDAAGAERVLTRVRELLEALEAEEEVERLIAGAEARLDD